MAKSWKEFGERVALARRAAGYTQSDLASSVGLDRTAVSKMEGGTRRIDSLELARISEVLRRPISWFLSTPSAAIISRRNAREGVELGADVLLESLAANVDQLIEMKLLAPAAPPPLGVTVDSVETAEQAALAVRRALKLPQEPLVDLVRVAEQLGLFVFVLELEGKVEGSYVALARGGVALIQGQSQVGRRRFTTAHELGHHVLADEYSSEWVKGGKDERERLISAFAIHLLMPRQAAKRRWQQLGGDDDAWNAAVCLAAEYGVSWSALCGQLASLQILRESERAELAQRVPGKADFMERMLALTENPRAPAIPPSYAAAVIKAFRGNRIGRQRVLELLCGTVAAEDLPEQHQVPMNAMLDELSPL